MKLLTENYIAVSDDFFGDESDDSYSQDAAKTNVISRREPSPRNPEHPESRTYCHGLSNTNAPIIVTK